MPVWLRNFTFRLLKEHYEKENEATDNSMPLKPDIDADGAYRAKRKR